jgi:hypothetical protein
MWLNRKKPNKNLHPHCSNIFAKPQSGSLNDFFRNKNMIFIPILIKLKDLGAKVQHKALCLFRLDQLLMSAIIYKMCVKVPTQPVTKSYISSQGE